MSKVIVRRAPRRRPKRNTAMRKVARQEARKVVNKNIETKSWDGQVQTSTTVNWTGIVYRMFTDPSSGSISIIQGTDDNEYLGTKIQPVAIALRCGIFSSNTYNLVTVIVFQNIGAFLPAGGAMTNVFQSTGNASSPLSPVDRDFNNRFRILARKTVAVQSVGPSAAWLDFKIKRKRLRPLHFNDALGTAESGDIYVGVISDSLISTPTFVMNWRMYFKDA